MARRIHRRRVGRKRIGRKRRFHRKRTFRRKTKYSAGRPNWLKFKLVRTVNQLGSSGNSTDNNIDLAATATLPGAGAIYFKLEDVQPLATNFYSLYKLYKLHGVQCKFYPANRVGIAVSDRDSIANNLEATGMAVTMFDPNDAIVPTASGYTALNAFLRDNRARVHMVNTNRPIKQYIKPRIRNWITQSVDYNSGDLNMQMASNARKSGWINAPQTSALENPQGVELAFSAVPGTVAATVLDDFTKVRHYGLKYDFSQAGGVPTGTEAEPTTTIGTYVFTYYVGYKYTRNLGTN